MWRYDISPVDGYKYDGLTIDVAGLEKGKIGAQLLIYWSQEGKVDKIEFWYRHTKSQKIVTHYVFPDGTTAGAIYE